MARTTRRPCLRLLLELRQHITSVVVAIEAVYIIEHENERLSRPFQVSEGYFLERIQCCKLSYAQFQVA